MNALNFILMGDRLHQSYLKKFRNPNTQVPDSTSIVPVSKSDT